MGATSGSSTTTWRLAVIDVVAGTTTIVPLDVSVGDATFDGTNVWLSLTGSDTVVKLPPQ